VQALGETDRAVIGQRLGQDQIARPGQARQGDGQRVRHAVADQQPLRHHLDAAPTQPQGACLAVLVEPGDRSADQHRGDVAALAQLGERAADPLGVQLVVERAVDREVDQALAPPVHDEAGLRLVEAEVDEGAAADLADHQAAALGFGIGLAHGLGTDTEPQRQLALGRQTGTGGQLATGDRRCDLIGNRQVQRSLSGVEDRGPVCHAAIIGLN
jgi:hypothetical protein